MLRRMPVSLRLVSSNPDYMNADVVIPHEAEVFDFHRTCVLYTVLDDSCLEGVDKAYKTPVDVQ